MYPSSLLWTYTDGASNPLTAELSRTSHSAMKNRESEQPFHGMQRLLVMQLLVCCTFGRAMTDTWGPGALGLMDLAGD